MVSLLRRRSKQTLGLDIGSGFVKAAVVDHSGPEPVLAQVSQLPLLADAIVEGEIMDPAQVAETIRGVLEQLGVGARNVVTSVGGRDLIVKKIQMDRMPADDAREVIRWEAEQHVPFDMANVQLDFQILDPAADGLQMNVLLVAAKRELVEQRMMLLGDAGLSPSVVDVDAFALRNALEFNYPEAVRGLVALVNVGHEVSSVIVMQDGAPVVTRDVPLGTRQVREDLRRRFSLAPEVVDAALQGRAEGQEELAPVFAERAQELAMGIERAVAFLAMDESVGRGLSTVFLAGGGAQLPLIGSTIADRLRVRVEVANPLQRLRVDPAATLQVPADEISPMLMLPIGLALRSVA